MFKVLEADNLGTPGMALCKYNNHFGGKVPSHSKNDRVPVCHMLLTPADEPLQAVSLLWTPISVSWEWGLLYGPSYTQFLKLMILGPLGILGLPVWDPSQGCTKASFADLTRPGFLSPRALMSHFLLGSDLEGPANLSHE